MNYVSLIILVGLLLSSCQNNSSKSNLNITDAISKIDIYEWDDERLMTTVESSDVIAELLNALNNATTVSTANMDFDLPDYKLVFTNDDDVVLTMGYFNDVVKLGVKGRYLDVEEDIMYQVEFQLPVH